MGEARRETGVGLLKGQSVGQTPDLVLKLAVTSPFLSGTCPFAVHATGKKATSGMSFVSGPTCEKHLNSSSFGK